MGSIRSFGVVTAILVLVLVVAGVATLAGTSERRITAYFTQAPNLYVGDQVRILGVEVGAIEEITPQPDQVKIDMTYEADHPVPADATAAIVAPTLVSGRYIQLAPVYRGGPVMPDGATIPVARTATPLEFDQIKTQITSLARELGPQASGPSDLHGPRGAVNRLIDVAANNLRGRGGDLHTAIRSLSEASTVLADGRQDLFATVRNLQVVVSALAQSDPQVARFEGQLAAVSEVLDENKENLATALATFDRVVPTVQEFVADNRDQLGARVDELTRISQNLAANRQELANFLQIAPTAFANLSNIYDQTSGSLTGALALTQFGNPAQFFCSLILGANSPGGGPPTTPGDVPGPGSPALRFCQTAIRPLGEILAQNNVPLNIPSIVGARPRPVPGAGGPGTTR